LRLMCSFSFFVIFCITLKHVVMTQNFDMLSQYHFVVVIFLG
jgi:hypothetical protein